MGGKGGLKGARNEPGKWGVERGLKWFERGWKQLERRLGVGNS